MQVNSDTEKRRLKMNHYDDLQTVFFKVINIYLLAGFVKDEAVFHILESLCSLFCRISQKWLTNIMNVHSHIKIWGK